MAKPKVSLADMMAQDVARAPVVEMADEGSQRSDVTALQRDNVKTLKRLQHTSLYLAPEVRRAIKEIAFQYDKKPHDLYIEGIDLMLAKYGKPTTQALGKK